VFTYKQSPGGFRNNQFDKTNILGGKKRHDLRRQI